MRPRDRAHGGDRLRLHRGAVARPRLDRRRLHPPPARGGRDRHQLLDGSRRGHRHLERRPREGRPRQGSGSRRRSRSPATAARRTSAASCTRPSRSTPSRRRAAGVAMSVDILRQVAETAAGSGITLGLEVVNRYESNVLNTASQAVEMCRRIGAPNVKVHLDVYHMNIEESDPAQAIVETGDYLGYFHTGDSHRGYMGSGTIDLQSVFRALVRVRLRRADHLRVLLLARRRPAARRHPRHLAQPLGGQRRPRQPRADVHPRPAQGGAGGAQAGGEEPPALDGIRVSGSVGRKARDLRGLRDRGHAQPMHNSCTTCMPLAPTRADRGLRQAIGVARRTPPG